MIHNNDGIELIDKHDYLRAYVTSEVLEILKEYDMTPELYKIHM